MEFWTSLPPTIYKLLNFTLKCYNIKAITSPLQVHVKGHAGHEGNMEADKLAKAGGKLYKSEGWARGP